jgi:ABC-type Fe3+/spermidine/putrescine transport system ATPase subunit
MGLLVDKLFVRRGDFVVDSGRLEVPAGGILGVVGRSGSGKSTLLEAIAGFVPAQSGTVLVNGVSVERLPPEKRRVALVFQRAALLPHWSLEENLGLGLRVQGVQRASRLRIAREWLARVGLADLGARLPGQISEGQAQRVALARALVVGFPVLLLDEPFSALDPQTRAELRPLVSRLVKETGVAAVFVSHHLDDLQALSDQVVEQVDGRIKVVG